MAVVRDNNKWNADLLTDLTSLGSDDGLTSDVVAWAVDQNNWYYPATISAASSTWTALSASALGDAVENTGSTNPALMDATFTWQIQQTQTLTFENSSTNNDLVSIAPASGADTVTLGWGQASGGGDTVVVDSQTFTVNSTTITLDGHTTITTAGTSEPVGIRTTTGFTGTNREYLTFANQITLGTNDTQTVVTIASLDTNGHNTKFDLGVTAGHDGTPDDIVGAAIRADYYRNSSGGVTLLGNHINAQNKAGGAAWTTDVGFAVTVSGNDILLEISNTNSSVTYTVNLSVSWWRQKGGLAS